MKQRQGISPEQDYSLVPALLLKFWPICYKRPGRQRVMAIENTIARAPSFPTIDFERAQFFGLKVKFICPSTINCRPEDVLPNQIREIHSHPMALQQCSLFLSHKYPGIKWVETEDTALSALYAGKPMADGHRAVIASQKAGQLMDLRSCHQNIENNVHNFTRFL